MPLVSGNFLAGRKIRQVRYHEIIDAVLKNDLDLVLSELNEAVSLDRVKQQRHAFFPSLGVGSNFTRANHRNFGSFGTQRNVNFSRYVASLSLNLSLNPGEQIHSLRAVRHEYEQSQFENLDIRQQALLRVSELYQGLLLRVEAAAIVKQLVENGERILEMVQLRTKMGVSLGSDLMRVRAKLALNQQQAIAAQNDWIQESIRLARILRWDPSVLLQPAEGTLLTQASVSLEKSRLYSAANRPDLKAAESAWSAAVERQTAAEWKFWSPSFDLQTRYLQLGTKLNDFANGERYRFSLSWDFSFAGWDQIQIQNKKVSHAKLRLERENDLAKAEIIGATYEIKAALARIPLTQESQIAAKKNLELVVARYRAGKVILIEALDAEDILARSRLSLAEAVSAYNIAQIKFLVAIGGMTRKNLLTEPKN